MKFELTQRVSNHIRVYTYGNLSACWKRTRGDVGPIPAANTIRLSGTNETSKTDCVFR